MSECIFLLITTLLVWRFKKNIYIYTPSWKNVLLYSAINLNNSSHVNFHPYSTMYHHIMDKAHVTEKILEATMWPLANYCFLSINFIEIRFAYMLNPPILSVQVFSQMCAPISPSPWLQHKTSPSPKELLSCLFPALSFCYCISTGLISSGYRSFHIQWIWTFLSKFIKKLESPQLPSFFFAILHL